MEVILVLLLIITIWICLLERDYDKKIKMQKKEIRKLKKEIKQIQDDEFYLFDYLEGIYEEIERGSADEKDM